MDKKSQYFSKRNEFRNIDKLLDTEISRLYENYKKPGWTKWALLICVASILWLIVGIAENSVLNQNIIMVSFLLISYGYYFLKSFRDIFESSIKDQDKINRLRISNQWYSSNRLDILLTLIHFGILLIFCILTRNNYENI